MTPAHAAAAKNISIVVGSEVEMTPEELDLNVKDLDEKIARFAPDEKLSNREYRDKRMLVRQKDLLVNLKKARENCNSRQEAKLLTEYTFLKDDRKMNPFIKYIMHLKLRSQLWM
jgi:hypothetical protein